MFPELATCGYWPADLLEKDIVCACGERRRLLAAVAELTRGCGQAGGAVRQVGDLG